MSTFDRGAPGGPSRTKLHHDRVTELLTHLAAEFIVRVSNGTSLITATRSEVSSKGSIANVFVTVFPETSTKQALEFLNRQSEDFRDYVKQHSRMRDLPRVTFSIDVGELNRQRLDELGKEI